MSYTLPPNLERALRHEKDEIEFHVDRFAATVSTIDGKTEEREEARSEAMISEFTRLALDFSHKEK